MSNNSEFYNSEVKERFLNTIDNPLIKTFTIFPLRKAKNTEEIYKKDLYDMTESQLQETVRDFTCTSLQAVQNYVSKVEEYINWAIENGYRKSNINPLASIDKNEWCKNLVATSRNYYFDREDVIEMMSRLVNETDKAVLLALFEGIKGKGFSEILNLKVADITEKDNSYWANLKDDGGTERTIEISKLLAETLKNANKQPEYISKNGQSIGDERHDTSPFDDSPLIFKKTNRGKQGGQLTYTFVQRKFIMYKEVFGLEHFKPKHVTDSGIMHLADSLQEDQTVTTIELVKIADHFNTTYTYVKDAKYRNTTVIRRIVELNEFEELYDYKMKFTIEKQYK